MFQESDRVQIRLYLGYSGTYLQADPRLESAIKNVQSIADGGTRPDSSTETLVRGIISSLQNIDTQITILASQQGAGAVGSIRVDAARETARLRMVGRQYVHRLARVFDTQPHSDIFSSAPLDDGVSVGTMPGGFGKTGY
jgi:hypothetical protein